MTHPEDRSEALARLVQLRDAGAITPEDYQRLVRAVNTPTPTRPTTPSAGSRFVQNAGSIAAGVFAGSMAADLLTTALSDPAPVTYEYTATTETTFTDNGFVTTTQETLTPDDGTEPASTTETTEYVHADASGSDFTDGDFTDGGYEDFGGFEV